MSKIDDLLTDIFKKNNNDIVYLNYVIFYIFIFFLYQFNNLFKKVY